MEILDGIRALVPFLTSRPLRFKLVREYVIAYAPEKNRCGWWPCFTDGEAPA
jgi:hypothetical protein